MPLPHPPGYQRRRQRRVDRRRILLSAVLAASAASLLLVGGAAGCAAWGETMRQLALAQLGEPLGPENI